MVEEAKYECRACKRFDEKNHLCRKDDRTVNPNWSCEEFRMKLADHFVPNVWDEWKKKKERGM